MGSNNNARGVGNTRLLKSLNILGIAQYISIIILNTIRIFIYNVVIHDPYLEGFGRAASTSSGPHDNNRLIRGVIDGHKFTVPTQLLQRTCQQQYTFLVNEG